MLKSREINQFFSQSQNVDKKVFDYSGTLVLEKSGYWFMDMDVNSVKSIEEYRE